MSDHCHFCSAPAIPGADVCRACWDKAEKKGIIGCWISDAEAASSPPRLRFPPGRVPSTLESYLAQLGDA